MNISKSLSSVAGPILNRAADVLRAPQTSGIATLVAVDAMAVGVVCGIRDAMTPNAAYALVPHIAATNVDIGVGSAVAAVGILVALGSDVLRGNPLVRARA